jgi:predicted DNA-binding transcriptional regulator AlpA
MNISDRLLSRTEVRQVTGMSRYLIDLLESEGAFPQRMRVGQRRVYWSGAEVSEFLETAKSQRPGFGSAEDRA